MDCEPKLKFHVYIQGTLNIEIAHTESFNMKQLLFGAAIIPACCYCEYAFVTDNCYSCAAKGKVAADFSCKKFLYDPFKRIPKKKPVLPEYKREEFSI